MCPIIEDADLTQVNTANEPLPEDTYDVEIFATEYTPGEKPVTIIKSRVLGGDQHGREVWDFLHMRQKDGKRNEVSAKQLKRYFEAALGEAAANVARPNTDDLLNGRVRLHLTVDTYQAKDGTMKTNNKVKRILPAR